MQSFLNQLFVIPPDTDALPGVVRNFKRNFTANFFDIAIFFFGDSFVAPYTILPVFVSLFTDSPILIALVPAITEAGWFIPQLFFAPYVERQPKLKSLVIKLGSFERVSYLFLAIGAFLTPRMERNVALVVIMVLVIYKAFVSGLVALPWQEIVARVIPVSHRGRLYGWAMLLGKALGIGGAVLSGYMISELPFPKNYGFIFLIGFIVLIVGIGSFAFTREPEAVILPKIHGENVRNREKIKAILLQDAPFRNFLISRFLAFLGYMAFGLFAVYGIEKYNLSPASSATFTVVLIATGLVGYAVFGVLGDRIGNKFIFAASDVLMGASLVVALSIDSLFGLFMVFALIGVAQSGTIIADMNMVMEFSHPKDRPTYMGIFKTLTGPAFLLSPFIGGGIVQIWGYKPMFFVALLITLIAFIVLVVLVPEPRHAAGENSIH